LNSVVCIAQVPDTESRIKIAADGRHIDETGLKFIVSPYDEYALEEAIRLKEKQPGDVTVLSFGPDRVQQALRESLARGATKALHIKGDAGDADALGIAKVLAAAIKTIPHDVVFFGKQGVGTDNSLVGPMVAELLDYPQVNVVTHVELGDGKLTAHREIEGAEETIECPLPAVITAQKGLNEPRYASLKGIMAAKKKTIAVKKPADLGVDAAAMSGENAAVRWTKLELPPARQAVKLIPADDPAKAAEELIRLLRDEAKVL